MRICLAVCLLLLLALAPVEAQDEQPSDRGVDRPAAGVPPGASVLQQDPPGQDVCGNGIIEASETCDDGDTIDGDGCSSACQVEPGWSCEGEPSVCTLSCCGLYNNGYTGNTNCSTDGRLNLGDLLVLIAHVYSFCPEYPLCCEENANVDGDPEGRLYLADIGKLIRHIYQTGEPTAPCP